MAFFDDYEAYKKNHNLVSKFLIHIGALKLTSFLDNVYIQSNHTYDGREGRAVVEVILYYPDNVSYINKIVEIDHGLFEEGIHNREEYPDGIKDVDHYELLVENNSSILECNINESSNILKSQEYDNYKRTIKLIFDFRGEMEDVDILNEYAYYVYVRVIMANKEAPYWCNLVVQAIELKKEKKYELALLLMFSAFDNFISLEIEKLNVTYFSEFDLEKLEFGKKVSLLLKHCLNVIPGKNKENHSVKDLIFKMYKDLYDLRNAVAHGNRREIEENNFEKCLDMLIFTYTAINGNPIDNMDLIREVKIY